MVQDKKGCHNLTHLRPQNYIQVLSNEPIPKGGSELPVIKDFQIHLTKLDYFGTFNFDF